MQGWAFTMQGRHQDGAEQIRQGLNSFRTMGARLWRSYYLALDAEVYSALGQYAEGLRTLAEALAAIDETGERFYEAEIHRLKGELLLQQSLETVIIPNLCQECHKHHLSTFVKECRLCSDVRFSEQILCNLVRDEIGDKDHFECDAFRPTLSVINRNDTEPSQTEDESDNTEGMSPKEKWFKGYAVQQLAMNPDLIYAKLRYHVVFSTVHRNPLFSHQDFDRIDSVFHQAEFPFENTNVHLLCVTPDHIHLYIDASPDYALDEIVNAVMEYSEREIPMRLLDVQQNSHQALWERAYFIEGIG